MRIIILTCVFSCMCLYWCCSICLQRNQIASRVATSMLMKPLANLSWHIVLEVGEACKIVRVSHKGWGVGRGHREEVTADWHASWTRASGGSLSPTLFLECTFHPLFLSWEPLQGCNLERVRCGWEHLDGVGDWTSLRLLYKLLRFSQVGVEIYLSCGHPRQISYISPLAYETCHLPIWSALSLSLVSPFLPYMGPVSNFTQESPEVAN